MLLMKVMPPLLHLQVSENGNEWMHSLSQTVTLEKLTEMSENTLQSGNSSFSNDSYFLYCLMCYYSNWCYPGKGKKGLFSGVICNNDVVLMHF